MGEANVDKAIAQFGERKRRITLLDRYTDFIKQLEDTLNIPPEGDEFLGQRQGFILQAIEDLKSSVEVSELELPEQVKSATMGSINAVLDALGYSTLALLPAELQIRIRFSLDRLGLNPAQIFPDQNRLYDL